MKCPECQFENREGVKFCEECGATFELECPACKAKIPYGRKYCGKCGYKLKSTNKTFSEISKIEDPPSPISTNKKSSDITPITGERKHVTAMFSDLTGYTALSERMDPEVVKDITTQLFDKVSRIVGKYDGFIEKYAGDAVMALFGAKEAHEDDPVRAIKAAKEIHNVVNSLSPKYDEIIEQPLSMHTGINTGLVVTGDINLEKGTHGVAGDTLNVAARLSSLGNADDILVGSNTFHQAQGFFEFNELEPAVIKGKSEPIQVYRVVSQKEQPRKIHRLQGVRAKLIGRKVEMAQLQEAVDNLLKGKGTTFAICGTAGTGKSRLTEEFKATLNLKEIQWREGQAYPYAQNMPYFLLINLLNRAFQIEEGDPSEIVRKKIEKGVAYLIGNGGEVVPYIGSLYSLSYPEIDGVSPEFWKSKLQKTIKSILSAMSTKGPTIICLEDLHWSDPSSMELIRLILTDFRDPVLFLCVYRPIITLFTSPQISAMVNPYHEIQLQDLSPAESQDMIESLLDTENTPPELQRFVREKVEGNPFYLEEVANSLIESKTLVYGSGGWQVTRLITESDISSTIHGVIAARLDRLKKETKRILQEASVIGRTFYYEILKKITELNGNIDQCLSGLERLDLIKARSIEPDLEYIFKHALTQEVVYNGLLKKERLMIHERIGIVIEKLFRDRLPEFYETLAFHFKQGKSTHKAVKYLIKSGGKSARRYAIEESHRYYEEAFNILSEKSDKSNEDEEILIDLLIAWAYVFYYRGDINGLIDLFSSHMDLAGSLDDKAKYGMFNAWLGFAYWMNGECNVSYRYLQKALDLGEETGDQKVIGYACTWLTWSAADLGLFEKAISFGERAQGISKLFESDHYLFLKPLAGMAFASFCRGEGKKAIGFGKTLLEYGQRNSNIRSMAMGHTSMGLGHMVSGDLLSASECLMKAVQVAADPVYSIYAKTFLGPTQILLGRLKEAEKTLREPLKFFQEFGYGSCGIFAYGYQGVISIMQGKMSAGLEKLEEALNLTGEKGRKSPYIVLEYTLGYIYLQIVQGEGPKNLSILAKNIGFILRNVPFAGKKSEEHFNKAIETAKEIGASGVIGQSYLHLGLLHRAKKRPAQAKETILKAIKVFEKNEAEEFLKQAKEALASLE